MGGVTRFEEMGSYEAETSGEWLNTGIPIPGDGSRALMFGSGSLSSTLWRAARILDSEPVKVGESSGGLPLPLYGDGPALEARIGRILSGMRKPGWPVEFLAVSVETAPATLTVWSLTACAVALTAEELRAILGRWTVNIEVALRLLEVCSEHVERYAPDAPGASKNEAVIRMAGYLVDRRPGARRFSETVGSYTHSITHEMGHSALRLSGGMALLSPWKVRRAGVI